MILKIHEWEFSVNLTETMKYSAAEAAEHCTCAYCRNFYASVDSKYPNLRPFLAQFGVDIEAPAELSPYEPTVCACDYVVKGSILKSGREFMVDGALVYAMPFSDASVPSVLPEAENEKDWFVLCVRNLFLTWVLDEPMEEVISPANEPEFLEKMYRELLESAEDQSLQS